MFFLRLFYSYPGKNGNAGKNASESHFIFVGPNQMISLQVDEGALKVKAVSPLGRMEEELFLEEKEGENLNEIFLNARYLLDPLRVLEDQLMRIEFNGPLGPCVFVQNKNEENYRYRYLVLPIKTEKNSP